MTEGLYKKLVAEGQELIQAVEGTDAAIPFAELLSAVKADYEMDRKGGDPDLGAMAASYLVVLHKQAGVVALFVEGTLTDEAIIRRGHNWLLDLNALLGHGRRA